MANIALTAAQIAPVYPHDAEIYPFRAASAITAGQPLYQTTTGTVAPADANAAGLQQAIGVSLNAAAAGEPVSVLIRGHVAGFTVAAVNCGTVIFVSDDVGKFEDATGTLGVPVGRVVALEDGTRVIFFAFAYLANFA
jgi:hypothetical protein